jgi:hypothetical protein
MAEDQVGRSKELTVGQKEQLAEIEKEYARRVLAQDPAGALDLMVAAVGKRNVRLAAAHLEKLRVARIRSAAGAKGFRVGV